ncbi:MAG: class I SAM-dependent methyltransferase [Syntrophobacteraceae bacterium]
MEELLPDKLKRLWKSVEEKGISAEQFHREQERLIGEYRSLWKQALLFGSSGEMEDSVVSEIGSYLGIENLQEVQRRCMDALSAVKGEWQEKVEAVSEQCVQEFYNQSRAMSYELMWWHALGDDLSPLAYVVALHFARQHGCRTCLDFGSGVGSGGILFARHGFQVTLADISSPSLDFCKWRFTERSLHAHLIDLKISNLPTEAFDMITAMDVFEHLVNPVETVQELSRALKKGGFLFGRFHAEHDKDRPHHVTLDFEPTFKELKALGFTKIWQDEWLWGHEVFQKGSL